MSRFKVPELPNLKLRLQVSPFWILVIGIAFVVISITVFKIHPFFALLLAAVLVGILPSSAGAPLSEHWGTAAISLATEEFGGLAGRIGIIIAMAAVIGQCLMESGAADKITRRLLAVLGRKRANLALLGSGYVLSVPVFFDTVFFLLVPLARALSLRTGGGLMIYVMAICAGAVATHSIVPPTPGPLVMVEQIPGLDLGQAILFGFLLGLPPALLGGLWLPRRLSHRMEIPLRPIASGASDQLQVTATRSEKELPSFLLSIAPVALPVILITGHSIVDAVQKSVADPSAFVHLAYWTSFLGDKHFALFLGMAIAVAVLMRQQKYSLSKLSSAMEPALSAAGIIILITCAGGSFGAMLQHSGIGQEIQNLVSQGRISPTWFIVLAWSIAAVMKVAQGSGTVAIITASAIVGSILEQGVELPYHPVYIFAAVAFGSKCISWMNDSGFWVVCKMSGFTQEETLKTWTLQLGVMGVLGLIEILILSTIFPGA